jgi:hypothetical protein
MNIESKYKNRNRLHYKNSNNNMPYNIFLVKHLWNRQNLFNDLMAVVLTYYIII